MFWFRFGLCLMATGMCVILYAVFNTEPSLSVGLIDLGLGLALVVANWRETHD